VHRQGSRPMCRNAAPGWKIVQHAKRARLPPPRLRREQRHCGHCTPAECDSGGIRLRSSDRPELCAAGCADLRAIHARNQTTKGVHLPPKYRLNAPQRTASGLASAALIMHAARSSARTRC
jgi:hypothetical protein